MTAVAEPYKLVVWEDNSFSLMGRYTNDGTNIVQADISSIAYKLFDKAAPTVLITSDTLTVSTVVFDTLQTDSRWDVDTIGYNFRWDVPSTLLTAGGTNYRVELKFTATSGGIFHDVFEPSTRDLLGS
jgi:hypothetical protein